MARAAHHWLRAGRGAHGEGPEADRRGPHRNRHLLRRLAAHLQEDLRRAEIEPYGWIVNPSLAATQTTDPLLGARAAAEIDEIRTITEQHAKHVFVVPWSADEPTGVGPLRALMDLPHLQSTKP